ncbi:MAG: GGDEF domain-containing protein [Rhodobacterales bacterium]|nr:MAG: GGDEF domain-containing protein [Rhodobacterales bacterium]
MKLVSFAPDGLDVLMPMHVLVAPDGTMLHAGPTLAKVCPGRVLAGAGFHELFELRRPAGADINAACEASGTRISLRLRDAARTPLTATAICLAGGEGVLLNLSFGIAVVEAVARFGLAGSDFAATDLTLELLYLVEANAAAMEEASKTAGRLAGARAVAQAEALTDTLTGLYNRRALDQALARIVSRGTPFTLMHVDLDFFKAVNDTLGHAAGDLVLESVARVLNELTRAEDVVARVGGDEFVIVFKNMMDAEQLGALAGRVIERLEEPVPCGDGEARISASIGIAPSSLYARPDPERMQRDADAALYESKRRGRACYTLVQHGVPAEVVR